MGQLRNKEILKELDRIEKEVNIFMGKWHPSQLDKSQIYQLLLADRERFRKMYQFPDSN